MSARLLAAAFRGINIQTYPASIYTLSTQNEQQQLVKIIVPKNRFEMPVLYLIRNQLLNEYILYFILQYTNPQEFLVSLKRNLNFLQYQQLKPLLDSRNMNLNTQKFSITLSFKLSIQESEIQMISQILQTNHNLILVKLIQYIIHDFSKNASNIHYEGLEKMASQFPFKEYKLQRCHQYDS
ncbi:unnamed protein product [Paramecium sonneborni]|uniref:Uncharacterized protein n=1 Tax=Paramecium sonneborni TaxID=65129 RepID=A0A8S1R507_9CILI|nr:unnamed protein product [Paramecium sonneborni]